MSGAEILGSSILEWVSLYGYWFIIPVMIIEGTTVGFIAGFLASIGVFNPFILFGVYLAVRFTIDTIVYFSSLHGSKYLQKFTFSRRILERLSSTEEGGERESVIFLKKHFGTTFFLAKVLPLPALDTALLVTAGAIHIRARRFYLAFFAGQPIWIAMVIGSGYFLGSSVKNPGAFISIVGFVLGALVIFGIIYSRYMHEKLVRRLHLDFLFKKS